MDGDPDTLWHTPWGESAPDFPHELLIEWPAPVRLDGLHVLPRQDGNRNGWIRRWELYGRPPGQKSWNMPLAAGEWPANPEPKTVRFAGPVELQALKLRVLTGHATGPWASVAEITFLTP